MRARAVVALLGVVVAACGGEKVPPVIDASEVASSSEPASPSADPDQARLVELRATDQFDEFAEHERAAKADGARLAWENFAPIVDGKRVEWTNKAELWDSIAPKIRDEALLLGPEYRKPLWNTRNAIPNGVEMAWSDAKTEGRGDYAEFGISYLGEGGPAEMVWGFLIKRGARGEGTVTATMPPIDIPESEYGSAAEAFEALEVRSWEWIFQQSKPS